MRSSLSLIQFRQQGFGHVRDRRCDGRRRLLTELFNVLYGDAIDDDIDNLVKNSEESASLAQGRLINTERMKVHSG